MESRIRVTVWNEYIDELTKPLAAECYPEGIHKYFEGFLSAAGYDVRTATLCMPEHGLTPEILESTDVLIWFGHVRHHEVSDTTISQIHRRVLDGMGLILLHSSHASKLMRKLLGTGCMLKFREDDQGEILWVVDPRHPIAEGVPEHIMIPHEEMYGEYFDIPKPDELVFIGWFAGGEVFRSGCCFHRGMGRIFYFQPGHEEYPVYHLEPIQRILINAVKWAAPSPNICKYVQMFHEPLVGRDKIHYEIPEMPDPETMRKLREGML